MAERDLNEALRSATAAVRAAARRVRRHRYDPPALAAKPDGSFVTSIDLASERTIRRILRNRHPRDAIVGEEGGLEPGADGTDGWLWLVDPLDGTRAFAAGQDACAVAATLTRDGEPLVAAVAAPMAGELYTAVRGAAPEVAGRAFRIAPPRPLADADVVVYYDRPEPARGTLFSAAARGELGRMSVQPGSFILAACRVARGAYHAALWVKRRAGPLMPWDLAPAALIVGCAGGALRDLEGRAIGGLVPAREVALGEPAVVDELVRRHGSRIRDPRLPLAWARRDEPVFGRLLGRILTATRPGGPFLIGVGGAGGGIGKTTLARELAALLGPDVPVVALDDYLRPRLERDAADRGAHDPAASDLDRAAADLARLRAGETVAKPVYDHTLGRAAAGESVRAARFVVVEGVHAPHPALRPHLHLVVYLDAPAAVRFRRVARDVEEKGVTEAYARSVHERYEEAVRRFLLPLRAAADVVLAIDEDFRLTWVAPA